MKLLIILMLVATIAIHLYSDHKAETVKVYKQTMTKVELWLP